MMGSDNSKEGLLIELEEILSEGLGRKVGSVVEEVLLRNHSSVSTHELERFLGLEGFCRAEGCLQFDVDVPGSRVDKDATAFVHLALFCLAFAAEQTASSRTDEVIDRNTLSRKELILSKRVHTVSDNRSSDSRSRSLLLLGELTSGAHRRVDEACTRGVEASGALRGRQSAGSHQELDPPERAMSQTEVPARQLLLCLRKVVIDCRDCPPWWRLSL
jgi:hypothetical protein